MQFNIPLAQSSAPGRSATALHILIAILLVGVGGACGAFYWTSTMSPALKAPYYPARTAAIISILAGVLIFCLAVWERKRLQRGRPVRALPFLEIFLLLSTAVLLVLAGYYVPAGILGVAAIGTGAMLAASGKNAGSAEVQLDEAGIHRSGLVRRGQIRWREVKRVILRPGVLTVDCYDNRFYQWPVAEETDMPDKELLELQCAAWIAAAESERGKNDW